MAFTPRPAPTRRASLAALAAVLVAPWQAQAAARPRVITLLGDSITAGYGLPAAQALPAQLSAALARMGQPAQVRGAGVSGDTTADALARVDFSVQGDTDLVIVELGGNDLLQGVEPSVVRANLAAIIARIKARGMAVVLTGMRAPPVIGRAYAREFNAVYPAVARASGAALFPDLLASVTGDFRLTQKDGVHPNAQGVRLIAGRLAPFVARALRKRP